MQSRVIGIQHKKAHLYKGLTLLARDEFYAWALNSRQFWNLFNDWQTLGYARKATPSINRIDTSRGYELDNIEWLTHSKNSALGAVSKARRRTNGI